MKVAYVVSMFPCWSETFILNELVSHQQAGYDVDIFSIKKCNENTIHDEALSFINNTVYSKKYSNITLLLSHIWLFVSSPVTYVVILFKLLFLKVTHPLIKIKSLAVFWLSPTFIAAAKKKHVNHLHAHFATYPALLAWIIHRFLKIPYSFTAHAHDIYVNQDLLPIVCKDAATIVTISDYNKRLIAEKAGIECADKTIVIHCGIDLDRFKFDRDKDYTRYNNPSLNLLSIGRLSGIKGFTYLIEALRLLKEDGLSFDCNIIGDGPLKHELVQQVKDSGLEGAVHFLGSKKADEIPAYLRKADLFVLACATDKIDGHDGIPVVFMEAMAYGTPVIGTRISGIPELVIDGMTGFCAESENARSLADTIVRFLHCEDIRQIVGNAREIIENQYDIMGNSEKLRKVYQAARG